MAGVRRDSVPGGFLERMGSLSHARVERAKAGCDTTELRRRAEAAAPPSPLVLSDTGFDLIAEVKRRSPSAGSLADESLDPAAQARAYISGGATVLSVLTEPEEFSGRLDDLETIAASAGNMPVMRKDFLVSPYQVLEARAAGSAGVLLIAALLDTLMMRDMLDCAHGLNMFVLMEVFDQADVERCVPVLEAAGPAVDGGGCRTLLGVNCRDLRSLDVDYARFAALARGLPVSMPWVAESGISEPAQLRELTGLGYRLALIGTALMRSGDPAAAVRSMCLAGQ